MRLRLRRRGKLLLAAVIGAILTFLVIVLAPPARQVEWELRHTDSVDSPQFRREMAVLLGPPMVAGNRITPLNNGDEIFPPMLEAIRSARQSVTFETYIYWSGKIGQAFADALVERARAGVPVLVILDWVGSKSMDPALLVQMQAAGVDVQRFHPPAWYTLSRMNNRTHRKLLVVDGKVGFTGGVGIADAWLGDAHTPEHWRDIHFKVEGPVVTQLQGAFVDNWIKSTGQVLQGRRYFPPVAPAGNMDAQVFSSSPEGGADSMRLMYMMAIAGAAETIDLCASYFVPDTLTTLALVDAVKRGVRVRILLSGPYTDSQITKDASRAGWGPLLAVGAELHAYQPSLFHSKMIVVDGYLTSVGSSNFDSRSFRLNAESNLNIYDHGFGRQMTELFEADLAVSRRITLEEWQNRGWKAKLDEWVANLVREQL